MIVVPGATRPRGWCTCGPSDGLDAGAEHTPGAQQRGGRGCCLHAAGWRVRLLHVVIRSFPWSCSWVCGWCMPHLRECHARRVGQHDVAAACMRNDGAGLVEHTVRVALADHGCAHHRHVIMVERSAWAGTGGAPASCGPRTIPPERMDDEAQIVVIGIYFNAYRNIKIYDMKLPSCIHYPVLCPPSAQDE